MEFVRAIAAYLAIASLAFATAIPNSARAAEEDAVTEAEGAAQEALVFPMQEESVLDDKGNIRPECIQYGAAAIFAGPCGTSPLPDVTYPPLTSKAPRYGRVAFRASSGSPAKVQQYCYVLDATDPEADGYDLLYFDANGDRDLTNDVKIAAAQTPPRGLSLLGGAGGAAAVFDYLMLPNADDSGAERFLPWLSMQNRQQAYLIVMSTTVRGGKIRIGERSYQALIGRRAQGLSGLNGTLLLRPEGASGSARWQTYALEALQQADDEFFSLSLDEQGEQLTVTPYRGEYGEMSLQPGDSAPEKIGLAASLYKQDRSRLTLGDPNATDLPRQYRLPVGDYRASLIVDYGDVRATLSSQGFDVRVRADAPFVFQFTDKPDVVFTTPLPAKQYRPGDRIVFKAMLKTPATGMLLRGLYDVSKTQGQRTYRNADGTSTNVPAFEPLVPTITITDSAGKQVASGQMPFG